MPITLSKLYNSETYQILNAPSYTLAETSRLVGVSKGRIKRWLRGYEYTYEVDGGSEIRSGSQDALVNRVKNEDPSFASFLDLIDLQFVKSFLDRGFTLQGIRIALNDARKYLNTPHFASCRFFTYGKRIFLDKKNAPPEAKGLIALLTGGQQAFEEIVKPISDKIDFEHDTGFDLAMRWYPKGKNGHIVIDPQISFGKPTLIGRRLTTSNIFDAYLGENESIDRIEKWFNIKPIEIISAIQFERSMVA